MVNKLLSEYSLETDKEKVIESLDIWGSVAYLGVIPKNLILKYDFDYSN